MGGARLLGFEPVTPTANRAHHLGMVAELGSDPTDVGVDDPTRKVSVSRAVRPYGGQQRLPRHRLSRSGREVGKQREFSTGEPHRSTIDAHTAAREVDGQATYVRRCVHHGVVRSKARNHLGGKRPELVGQPDGAGRCRVSAGHVEYENDPSGGGLVLRPLRNGLVHGPHCARLPNIRKGFASSRGQRDDTRTRRRVGRRKRCE